MMLSDVCLSVCLSVAYIGRNSRTERPRKIKLGTEVAHVTRRKPLSRSKGQRSRSPGRFTHRGVNASGSCCGGRGNVFTVGTYFYVVVKRGRLGGARRFGAHRGRRWAGHIVAAPAQLVMPPPLIGGEIKRYFRLTSVCLSHTSGPPKSRSKRPRKTKIGRDCPRHT